MKAVILGGSGFIGSRIVDDFESKGIDCISFSSSQCNLEDLSAARAVLIHHLTDAILVIAVGIPRLKADNTETLCRNIQMISHLAEILEEFPPVGILFLSTIEVYGTPEGVLTEDSPIHPDTQYGVAKYTCELILQRLQRRISVPLDILRLPGVYGRGDKGRGMIGAVIGAIEQKQTFTLYGDGTDLRDFLFVGDIPRIIEQLYLTATESRCGIFNIASGYSQPIGEILHKIMLRYGKCPLKRESPYRPPVHLEFDNRRLLNRLPDLVMTPLEQGIEDYAATVE